ncbi:MAG: CHAD domain-containing protein, partial [Methylobacter sp.]|nr:CHAD domain-containing protein [Methylobacter sp.]
MSLYFEFPANLSADQFIAHTAIKQANAQLVSQHYSIKTYYDSFDWRLYSNGITCELNRSKSASYLTLTNLKTGLVIASTELDEVPKFSKQFALGAVRSTLEPILEMRALLPVCTLNYESYHLNIINKDEKIVVRLLIEEHE